MNTPRENFDCFSDPSIVEGYRHFNPRFADEERMLDWFAARMQSGKETRILDIAVGAGRTTPSLLALSKDYLGVDFSPLMVEAAKKAFPGVSFKTCDMRTLETELAGDRFDLIFISFNGIDYLGPGDRESVLAQVHRLLKDGGAFIFSSHNLNYTGLKQGFEAPTIELTLNPLKLVKRLGGFLLALTRNYSNFSKNRKREIHENGFAVLNESTHDYRLLTYYITLEEQERQLRSVGFTGELITDYSSESPDGAASGAPWIHYAAVK